MSLPRVINFNFLFQSLTRDISYSMENLAIDESWLNNHFSLHHSIIFFLNGWENLHYELGIERVNFLFHVYFQSLRQVTEPWKPREKVRLLVCNAEANISIKWLVNDKIVTHKKSVSEPIKIFYPELWEMPSLANEINFDNLNQVSCETVF